MFECYSLHVLCLPPYYLEPNCIELFWVQIKVLSCDCGLCMSLACCCLFLFTSTPNMSLVEHRQIFLGRGGVV